MHCSYFSNCIYVKKIPEQCCLGYHHPQEAKEGTSQPGLKGVERVEQGGRTLQLGLDGARRLAEGDVARCGAGPRVYGCSPQRDLKVSAADFRQTSHPVPRGSCRGGRVGAQAQPWLCRISGGLSGWSLCCIWDHWPSSSPSNFSMKNCQAPQCSIFISLFSQNQISRHESGTPGSWLVPQPRTFCACTV